METPTGNGNALDMELREFFQSASAKGLLVSTDERQADAWIEAMMDPRHGMRGAKLCAFVNNN